MDGRHRESLPRAGLPGARPGLAFGVVGLMGLVAAAVSDPGAGRAAADQTWPPFVLVAGLLLIGLVAHDDGLFAWLGTRLGKVAPSRQVLFAGAAVGVVAVTAVLNLDTSVAFVTPVLVSMVGRNHRLQRPLLVTGILLANAGSLFLPGSNLTNLIVLGHLHLSGGQFFARMWLPATAAAVTTAAVIAGFEWRAFRGPSEPTAPAARPRSALGVMAVLAAAVLVVVLRSPAIPVAGVGVIAVVVRQAGRRGGADRILKVLGLPVLVGLFGIAVALGTLGRVWSGPHQLLMHADLWGTAVVAALLSIVVNNLPAAALLAAHRPAHPFALLVGLNLGPNGFVTGSLAWFLWVRSARAAGVRPPVGPACRAGSVAVVLSLSAAVGLLALTGAGVGR